MSVGIKGFSLDFIFQHLRHSPWNIAGHFQPEARRPAAISFPRVLIENLSHH